MSNLFFSLHALVPFVSSLIPPPSSGEQWLRRGCILNALRVDQPMLATLLHHTSAVSRPEKWNQPSASDGAASSKTKRKATGDCIAASRWRTFFLFSLTGDFIALNGCKTPKLTPRSKGWFRAPGGRQKGSWFPKNQFSDCRCGE